MKMLAKMLGNMTGGKLAGLAARYLLLGVLLGIALPVRSEGKGGQMIYEPGEGVSCASRGQGGNAAYKYEGNLFSRKFHQPNCPYTLIMSRSRKVYFGARKLALAEGYKACRFCLPQSSRTVHACLIKKEENQAEQ